MLDRDLNRKPGSDEPDDLELVERARRRDADAFRVIMQRHNRRL